MSEAGTGIDAAARLLQSGDLEGARQLLQQAVTFNPADGRAHGLLGICLARQGDMAGCIHSLKEAARLLPKDAVAQYNLAMALARAGRPEEARPALQAALALKPDYPQAQALAQQLGGASAPAPAAPLPGEFKPLPGSGASPAPTGVRSTPLPGGFAPLTPAAAPPGPAPAPAGPPPFGAPPIGASGALNPHSPPGPPPLPPMGTPLGAEAGPPAWTPPPSGMPSPVGPPPAGMQPPGGALPPQWGPPLQTPAQSPQGLQYEGQPTYTAANVAVGLGIRLLRGWGWGLLCSQFWTLWMIIDVLRSGASGPEAAVGGVVIVVASALVYGFIGSIAGLIIGAVNPGPAVGSWLGVGVGVLLFVIESLVFKQWQFLNIAFYFFSGRWVGRMIALKVQG